MSRKNKVERMVNQSVEKRFGLKSAKKDPMVADVKIDTPWGDSYMLSELRPVLGNKHVQVLSPDLVPRECKVVMVVDMHLLMAKDVPQDKALGALRFSAKFDPSKRPNMPLVLGEIQQHMLLVWPQAFAQQKGAQNAEDR